MSAFADCLNHALALSAEERAALAHELLLSLETEPPDPDWEEAWAAEIQRRCDEIHSGKAVTFDAYEALERIRQSFRRTPE